MDVTQANFQQAVLDRSRSVPVVVDFWAPWCGPCRQLGPVLERAVAARAGKVELVKVNVDENPDLSHTYRVQGIPAVKAFRDGKVASEFVGAQPPAAVERFLDALVPSEADALVAAGDEQSLRRALELEPGRADAALALARMLHRRGECLQALELLGQVPGSFAADGLAARIELELAAGSSGPAAHQAAGSSGPAPDGAPGSSAADLQEAFAALDAGEHERGLELLLGAIGTADGARDAVRRVVVGVLDELGAEHPLARQTRRRLASVLY